MPDPSAIDPSEYVTAPRLSVPAAVALGIALLSAVPPSPGDQVHAAAERLREAVVQLQEQWRRKVEAQAELPPAPRDVDVRVDRCFRAVAMRLEALTLLRAEAGSEVERATAAHARLFPDGLRFLTLPFEQQWAHGEQWLARLDEDAALAADVEQLVGSLVLDELRAAQLAYGEVLGITAQRAMADSIPLAEPLSNVRIAIIGYAMQLVAMQYLQPERIEQIREALAPIDRLRARQARRSAASEQPSPDDASPQIGPEGGPDEVGPDEDTVTPETPVPTVA